MIFTKNVLAFSRANDDEVVDNIKLYEVQQIRSISARDQTRQSNDSNLEPENENGKSASANGESAKNIFQIDTTKDGYNAGRTYKVQMKSDKDFGVVVDELAKLCRIAKDKAEAKSKFKRIQDRVSKVYDSDSVQRIFSALIFAV
jgi:hypothetical protein